MNHSVTTSVRLIFTIVLATMSFAATAAGEWQIETVAGTGTATDNGAAGKANQVNIGQPFGVEVGPDGALYITEVENHRVRRLDLSSSQITTVAGSGKIGYAGDGGAATAARLNEPYEVRFDTAGNMFFVEMKNHLVRRVDRATGKISTVAGTGKQGFSGDGGSARRAMLNNPHSIAIAGNKYLYIADIGNHRIRRVDLRRGTIETIAGNGKRQPPVDGKPVLNQPMVGPRALFLRDGSLWIALREGHSVWRLDLKTALIHHIAGTGKKGYSGDGGSARKATFNGPKGITVSAAGLVYVVDTENQVIRQIDPSGDKIGTIAGFGPIGQGFGGDGGPANKAKMGRPHGICVGPSGTLFIGDTNNHRVQKISQSL